MGDELIRHHRLALFELVKNAYDADAPRVQLTFYDIETPDRARIVIEDSGEGMDLSTVLNIWLEPGANHRAQQRKGGRRTPRFGRWPVGEKGIGRFASHKLGNKIVMVTRRDGNPEISVEIDWEAVAANRYLHDAEVEVMERDPEVFRAESGTRIEISQLRQAWSRGDVRRLYRAVAAMKSPFGNNDAFTPEVNLVPDPGWTEGMISPAELNRLAMFEFSFELSDAGLSYDYRFNPLPGLISDYHGLIRPRERDQTPTRNVEFFRFVPRWKTKGRKRKPREEEPSLSDLGIGTIRGRLFAFDRDRDVMTWYVPDRSGLEGYLDEQGGMRVYRDGLRVHDYGEPGNDWLGLDVRRVQSPTLRLSNNVVVGEVHLEIQNSKSLIEKTSREGFVENEAYSELRYAVLTALAHFESLRAVDKTTVRNAIVSGKEEREASLSDGPIVAMQELKRQVLKKGLYEQIGTDLEKVERVYKETHETLLSAVGAGLGLSMVFHELERGMRNIERVLTHEPPDIPRVRSMAEHLVELLDGASNLVRASTSEPVEASSLVNQAKFVFSSRFSFHKVGVEVDFSEGRTDFQIKGARRMLVASLANILDNAIHWTQMRHGGGRNAKRIWVGGTTDFEDGPAIVVADNGPGFSVEPHDAVQPFRTTKQDGMGLGLYFVNLTMKAHGGRVAFPKAEDVGVPPEYDGAIVALVFGGVK